jgi:trans-aconitate methyltransferase
MKLVADKVLEESPIVANCRMNRERNLSGSNGYDVELRFKPLEYLATTIKQLGTARWLDLCCGTGKALIEAAKVADAESLPLEIIGVDLAGLFLPSNSSRLALLQASLSDWQPGASFDLITCIHGLHYIGDKLGLIARTGSWLTDQGRFTANLDMANIRLSNGQSSNRIVSSALRKAGFDYSSRNKLIQCDGRREVQLPFRYLGADDQAGPNYTGQPAVDSYYERLQAHK